MVGMDKEGWQISVLFGLHLSINLNYLLISGDDRNHSAVDTVTVFKAT